MKYLYFNNAGNLHLISNIEDINLSHLKLLVVDSDINFSQLNDKEEEIFFTYSELKAKMTYSNYRRIEYDLLNQDELRFNDLENNTTTWQDAINAIKAKYPKPE